MNRGHELNQLVAEQKQLLAALPARVHEQLMWSNGLRYADRFYRNDETRDIRSELLCAGGEEVAFWRGLAEGSGCILMNYAVYGKGAPKRPNPFVQVYGSKLFLWTLLEWMYDRNPWFDRAASGISGIWRRKIAINGQQARGFVEILWPTDDCICYETNRPRVADIKGWIPRDGSRGRSQYASTLIDAETLRTFSKVKERPPYKHLFDKLGKCGENKSPLIAL